MDVHPQMSEPSLKEGFAATRSLNLQYEIIDSNCREKVAWRQHTGIILCYLKSTNGRFKSSSASMQQCFIAGTPRHMSYKYLLSVLISCGSQVTLVNRIQFGGNDPRHIFTLLKLYSTGPENLRGPVVLPSR